MRLILIKPMRERSQFSRLISYITKEKLIARIIHTMKTRCMVTFYSLTDYSAWLRRLREILENHAGLFSNFCHTLLEGWIFQWTESRFSLSYVDKWKKIKIKNTLTTCHTEVHFGLSLRSAIWTMDCESTTMNYEVLRRLQIWILPVRVRSLPF